MKQRPRPVNHTLEVRWTQQFIPCESVDHPMFLERDLTLQALPASVKTCARVKIMVELLLILETTCFQSTKCIPFLVNLILTFPTFSSLT
jgi:hypothetical protein